MRIVVAAKSPPLGNEHATADETRCATRIDAETCQNGQLLKSGGSDPSIPRVDQEMGVPGGLSAPTIAAVELVLGGTPQGASVIRCLLMLSSAVLSRWYPLLSESSVTTRVPWQGHVGRRSPPI